MCSGSLPVTFRSRSHGLTPEILVATATRLTQIGHVIRAVCVRGMTEESHETRSSCAVMEVGVSAADPHISSIERDPFSDHHRHRPTQIHPHGNRPRTRHQHLLRITTHRSDTRGVHAPADKVENVAAADLGDRKRRRSRPPPRTMAPGGGGIGPRHPHHRNSPCPAALERFPTQEQPYRRSCSGIRRGHARRCPAGATRI